MKYICWFYYYVELFILPFLHAVFSQISIYCVLINKQSITQVLKISSLSFSFCFVCLTFFLSWQLSVLESLWGYQTSFDPYIYFTKLNDGTCFLFRMGHLTIWILLKHLCLHNQDHPLGQLLQQLWLFHLMLNVMWHFRWHGTALKSSSLEDGLITGW
jgi:hypothetical protein